MKFILILLFLTLQLNSFGQFKMDSIRSERIYDFSELTIVKTPDSISFPFFEVDTLTLTPINGWLKNYIEGRFISFEHYQNGLSNGTYIQYEFINSKYRMIYYCLRHNGWTYKSYDYKWKKDSIHLNEVFLKSWTDNYYLRRKIKLKAKKNKVIDNYYFYDSEKSKKIRYKIDSLSQLYNGQLTPFYFPLVLTENLNPFTFLVFDGYYRYQSILYKRDVASLYHKPDTFSNYNELDTIPQIDTSFSFQASIRFYSDGIFKQKSNKYLLENQINWDSENTIIGTYEFDGNKILLHYSVPQGFNIISAIIDNTYKMFKLQNYLDSPIQNRLLQFIPDIK